MCNERRRASSVKFESLVLDPFWNEMSKKIVSICFDVTESNIRQCFPIESNNRSIRYPMSKFRWKLLSNGFSFDLIRCVNKEFAQHSSKAFWTKHCQTNEDWILTHWEIGRVMSMNSLHVLDEQPLKFVDLVRLCNSSSSQLERPKRRNSSFDDFQIETTYFCWIE